MWGMNTDKGFPYQVSNRLAWIKKITGHPLDDARDEVDALHCLWKLRHHLNHFDPPCFVVTVDEVAAWLNLIPILGRLLWKIREHLDGQVTSEIVEIILGPRGALSARTPGQHRPPQLRSAIY